MTRPCQQKTEYLPNCGLCCSGRPQSKIEGRRKRYKYLNLARELKKLGKMKVIVISSVIGALGTVTKVLVKGREELDIKIQVDTIQTTALLGSARILRRVLPT